MESGEKSQVGYLSGATLCGRYFLRQFVGSGGTAEVYLAWDRIRSAKMAVKVLRPQVDQEVLHLFEKEAELLRTLEHPFIVRRYDLERQGELVFLVMDWIEGKNLRQHTTALRRPLTLDETANILQPVCSALSFTHQNGVYHCDIKPANIMLHVDGRVLLTDFGVARLATEIFSGGTPAYMAPEQVQERAVSAHTDIYALGVTLYESLSGGVMPFRGDSENSQGSTQSERIKWEHCYSPAPPLNQYNPNLPAQVVQVVHRALNKDPSQRYATPLTLLDAFEKARSLEKSQHQAEPIAVATQLQTMPRPVIPPRPAPQAPNPVFVGGPHLFCKAGQYAGQVIPINGENLDIGRQSGSQLWLGDRSVSRKHARLVRTRRAVYIQDEGSSLGTFVNGRRVLGPQMLKNGDVIVIGSDQIFEFRDK